MMRNDIVSELVLNKLKKMGMTIEYSTIGTTEKIYAHFEEEEHLISAGRIAKALQPDSDNPDERSLPAPKGKSDFEM